MRITHWISTLSGSTFINYVKALKGNRPPFRFYPKLSASAAISMMVSPLAWFEQISFGPRLGKLHCTEPPVFIIGHWRSGTTYLHNLMSRDPQFGYFTTYQSLFPHTALIGRKIFKPFVKGMIPAKRPADNVPLAADYPQEEEFALGNMNPYCFYYWWYFPSRTEEFFQKYLLLEGLGEKEKLRWQKDYKLLCRKALINTNGKILLSKNPPNTGRVQVLAKMFPGARFIHIYRNPVMVYLSTKRFFLATLPDLALQEYSEEEVIDNIFFVYRELMKRWFRDSWILPKQSYLEIRYEDLLERPLEELEKIYRHLGLKGFAEVKPGFEDYINSQQSHRPASYQITRQELDRILDQWQFAMDRWDYSLPANLRII